MNSRNALLTGASRGIGPFIARSLAAEGYNLVLASRSRPELEALARELEGAGTRTVVAVVDLTAEGAIETLVRTAERDLGPIDVLVNNAGGDPQREFDAMTWSQNEAIVRLNLIAPVQLTHRLLPGMLSRGRGHIVNISAIAGRVGFPFLEAYAAAKDGLIGFTRVLRQDYRARGVSASVVILGAIRDAGQGQRTNDEIGTKMPKVATSPATAVGNAVVRAIAADRAEIVVMPGPGRVVLALLELFPSLGATLNRVSGANAAMARVIAYRRQTTA
ncbi:MAG TPA: SDR family NAD(P)-dependent oxidoreductase [Candidatus Dormibacteraeota bacterium]|nr:SDR family NAD(P)-dependent oxidoreductase [Candidatus Dormibacteraeota bacterium]HEV2476448.1 SDR family NAD(P)-dependent oxidoreductase [Candidatus Dormibacteraeota bacterium]